MLADHLSIVALSKLYDLDDPRINDIQVKGDLIVQRSDRIMTRSRAKQNPDQYTVVSARLKIIKLLVEELLSASGNHNLDPTAAADFDDEDDDDDDGDSWEDEDGFLDLSTGMTKSQLMSYGAEDNNVGSRGRDDETQTYLLSFFRQASQKPGFMETVSALSDGLADSLLTTLSQFNSLTPEEQEKLRTMSDA